MIDVVSLQMIESCFTKLSKGLIDYSSLYICKLSLAKLIFINLSLNEFAYFFRIINLFMRKSFCDTSVEIQHLFWHIKPLNTNNKLLFKGSSSKRDIVTWKSNCAIQLWPEQNFYSSFFCQRLCLPITIALFELQIYFFMFNCKCVSVYHAQLSEVHGTITSKSLSQFFIRYLLHQK